MLGCCKVIFSESTAAVSWACGYLLSGRPGEMSKTAPWCTSCSPNTKIEGSNTVVNSLICRNNILHPIFIYAFFKHWQRGTFVLVWETIRLWETAFCWRFSRCTELDANNPHWAHCSEDGENAALRGGQKCKLMVVVGRPLISLWQQGH